MPRFSVTHRSWLSHILHSLACLLSAIGMSLVGVPTAHAQGTTALAALSATMVPGTWAQLPTQGLGAAFGQAGGSSGVIDGYAEGGFWNPNARTAYFFGGDHNGTSRFVAYDDATNTWTILPQAPWVIPYNTEHGHDHNTGNAAAGVFYHRLFGSSSRTVQQFRNGAWTALPPFDPSGQDYVQDTIGVAHFPGTGLIVYNQGQGSLYRYDEVAGTWTTLVRNLHPPAGVSGFAEYSPGANVVLFGGGAGQLRSLWRLNPDRTVTPLAAAPLDLAGSNTVAVITADPVSADFLVLGQDGSFRSYNALTDTWTSLAPPPSAVFTVFGSVGTPRTFGVIAIPASTYGVVVFVSCDPSGCRMHVYKHGAAPSAPPGSGADADFQNRCADPAVVRCEGFDAPLAASFFYPGASAAPQIDPTVKASGTGALKFTIPSNSPANMAGAFTMNFTPGSLNASATEPYPVQFGEGEEFYVQFRYRVTPEFLTTSYLATDGSVTGPKLMIVGTGDRPGIPASSCTDLEIVGATASYHNGVPPFPRMYHSCGAKDGVYEGLYERMQPFYPEDYRLQNGQRTPPLCLWASQAVPPCIPLQANQWMTVQLRVKIGTWYQNTHNYRHDSVVQMWVAEEGQPSQLVIDFSPQSAPDACAAQYPTWSIPSCQTGYDLYNPGDGSKYGKVWLLPYMTGKDPTQAHPTAYVWYDELIVSRSRIPDPGETTAPAPPEPPPSPSPTPTPPPLSVSIVSPGANSTVAGDVTVAVSADTSATQVDLYTDGGLYASSQTKPFSFLWKTQGLGNGSHSLKAVAHAGGATATSPTVAVTISNLSVAITSVVVANNILNVSVTVAGSAVVKNVELYLDGSRVGRDNSFPYAFRAKVRGVAAGSHTLVARVYDRSGNVSVSAPVAFTK